MSRRLMAVVIGVSVLSACGGGGSESQIILPPTTTAPAAVTSTSTTLPPAATVPVTTRAPATGPWVSATANLADLPAECGNMAFVWPRPGRDFLVASVGGFGLFASENGAETWTPLGTGPGSDPISHRATAFVQDPENPDRFWESGIYGDPGVFRTDDNGTTFSALGGITFIDVVSVDLTDPERRTLLAGMHEAPRVYKSTDGGLTWGEISAALPPGIGGAQNPLVIDRQTYLVGTNGGDASGIYRSADGGATWSSVFEGGVVGPPLRAMDGTLYWLVQGRGVVASEDNGVTWQLRGGSRSIETYAVSLVELPDGRLASWGERTVVVSADKGATWARVGPNLPYTPNGLSYSPARKSFYIWKFGCGDDGTKADWIMRLPFDYETN